MSVQNERRKMRLGAVFIPGGSHKGAWRDKGGQPDAGVNFRHWQDIAQTAERAKFDLVFLADHSGVHDSDQMEAIKWEGNAILGFEPITLLSALAPLTRNIGLVATASTSFHEPYNVARKFASLDLISGGRSGWNLVTSHNDLEAMNFNREALPEHGLRYQRAEEYADVVLKLWDSWEADAFMRDVESGQFFDPRKVRIANHRGTFFSVRGPLNVPRSPQGRPVMVQAGSSGPGMDLAARCAEVVFTGQNELSSAQAFYRDLKGRLAAHGRQRSDVLVLPGFMPIVGSTEAEARRRDDYLKSLIHPELAMTFLSKWIGVDARDIDPDGPVPDAAETNAHKSRQRLLLKKAREENMSVRELSLLVAQTVGHGKLVGTPAQIADHMEEWFEGEAADGFAIIAAVLPYDLRAFSELVIPELQRRGLFRTEYEGATLRENLGLPAPGNAYSRQERLMNADEAASCS